MLVQYPLKVKFKIFAFAPQFYVYDANGNEILYVKQKLFKLKEAISVYKDRKKKELLYTINADRIIDFSARYHFHRADGTPLGSIKRRGLRSIFKARYDLYAPGSDQLIWKLEEENPFAKFIDGLVQQIPLIGFLSCILFHPKYGIKDLQGNVCFRATKQPALFEGRFKIEKLMESEPMFEEAAMMAIIMMLLLERQRG